MDPCDAPYFWKGFRRGAWQACALGWVLLLLAFLLR